MGTGHRDAHSFFAPAMWDKWDRSDDTWRPPTSASSSWRSRFFELAALRSSFDFLHKIVADARLAAKTPGWQILAGFDFASGNRKSFTCRSRHSVDLRLQYEDLKVRELFTNSSAMSLNSGSGAITGSKLMR